MKKYNKTDYAKNKMNKSAIVYSHIGEVEQLTFEKVSVSDPKITQEEFNKFKKLSDHLFHVIDKGDHVEESHRAVSIENDEYDGRLKVKSAEDTYFESCEPEDGVEKIMRIIDENLTAVEKSRLIQFTLGHKKMTEIAKEEGVSVNVVSKSIRKARKKLKEIFRWRG